MKIESTIRIQLTAVDYVGISVVGEVKRTATDDVFDADQEANVVRLAENMVREAFRRLGSRTSPISSEGVSHVQVVGCDRS